MGGETVGMSCSACGRPRGPRDRHCGGCGARLTPLSSLEDASSESGASPGSVVAAGKVDGLIAESHADREAPAYAGAANGSPSGVREPAAVGLDDSAAAFADSLLEVAAAGTPIEYVLVISQPNQPDRTVPLLGSRWTIGRGAGCDVVLDAPSVSRLHAFLEADGDRFVLRDRGSGNGLYQAGIRVVEASLAPGEEVRIPDPFGNMLSLSVRPRTPDLVVSERTPPEDRSRTIPLGGAPTTVVGRDEASGLRLDLPLISRHHAQLERQGEALYVRDLGSTNGTFVNGERIATVWELHVGDELRFGPARFLYEGGSLRQFVEQPSVRIDAVNLVRRVGKAGQVLLDTVSLSIQPREFVALIGGSGAGKSTLMNALCGAAPAQGGLVLFNGQDFYRRPDPYRGMIGYVPQDDILHRDLPVGQALDYAAQLRLPPDTTAEERARRINEVLAEVRMEGHREQVISRLSGGQRKRVSIAAELLAQPSVLFLDEPTSGLDPGLDKTVMGLLRLLCDKGRTIILVTHATENIGQCTLVAFMRRGGSLAYFGPPRDALAFFGVSSMPDIYTLLEQDGDPTSSHQQRFQESPFYQRYVLDRRQEAAALTVGAGAAPRAAGGLDLRGGLRQWGILSRRYAELLRRDRLNLLILLAQAPVVGLLLFLVVSSQSYTSAGLSATQQVLLMLTLAAIWFGTINAAREIVKERPIYLRERLATLRLWPYILSKFAVLSLLSIGQSIVLLGIVSLKTPHLPMQGVLFPPWLEMAITLSLTSLAALAGGLLLSSLVSSADRAMSLVPIVLLAQVVLCGGVFQLSGATSLLARLFISRWCLSLLGQIVDLNRLAAPTRLPGWPDPLYGGGTTAHLLIRWAVLAAWGVVFLIGTYWSLRRKDPRKA